MSTQMVVHNPSCAPAVAAHGMSIDLKYGVATVCLHTSDAVLRSMAHREPAVGQTDLAISASVIGVQ